VAHERARGDAGLRDACSQLLAQWAGILKTQIQFAEGTP